MTSVITSLMLDEAILTPYTQKTNGTISNAIKLYTAAGVPLRQLLSDFNDVLSNPTELREAFNPWEHLNNKRNIPIVCGVSAAETVFNTAAMSLYRQKPIAVIKSIYYRNQGRNDSALERVFLDTVLSKVTPDEKCIVVNPSPFVVENIEAQRTNNCYILLDQTLASLYSKQFRKSKFVELRNISSAPASDVMIIFMSGINDQSILENIMDSMNKSSVKQVVGIFHTRLIDNKQSVFWSVLSNGSFVIKDIVIIPTSVSHSSPKKKCFVVLDRKPENNQLTIQMLSHDSVNKKLIPTDTPLIASQDLLIKYSTLNLLWNKEHSESEESRNVPGYASAELYPFSREIYISYALYHGKNNVYGKAYYAAIKNTAIPSVRGKALTPRTERGLRHKTVDEIINALEDIPYNSTFSAVIVADIANNYFDIEKNVSLKTLWFCLRGSLKKNNSYDDEYVKAVFGKCKSLSSLYPSEINGEKIDTIISDLFEAGEEVKEYKLLKMLNLIIEDAIKKGYLSENRLLHLLPAAQNRASKRQSEVRQALTKRSFEEIEEGKIFKYIRPLCVKSSLYLAVAIRLLSGISVKEVCGILWNDFEYDKDLGIYKLLITKFVGNNGKVISHALRESWEKYRVLPLSSFLGTLIEERRQFLITSGLDADVLKDYPIILARENIINMSKGYKPEYCNPSLVAKKCREAIAKAEIVQHFIILPEGGNEIETDINAYNGDIFRTNFRDKALNEAGFGLDELNYYLGLKKPDTFSQHYCDYKNDYVQLIMAKKLNRWTLKYDNRQILEADRLNALKFKGINEGVPCVELEINYKNDSHTSPVSLEAESDFGYDVTVSTCVLR